MSAMRDATARGLNAIWYGQSRLAWLLWPAAMAYRALVALRRLGYRRGWLRSFDVGVPVVVVGNLTVGGTGKTPLTVWLANRLVAAGLKTGIVCRGYRGRSVGWPVLVDASSQAAAVGDEAVLLARRTACPVAAGPDRVASARRLLEADPLDVILSDDGLQHYRLRRRCEIAVVDGKRGFGNGLCLPAGPLREPRSRLDEVDLVVANDGSIDADDTIEARVGIVRLVALRTGAERPLADLRGQKVHAVAAIGHPGRFFDLLARQGIVVEAHALTDHAAIAPDDLDFADGVPVLITEKDAVKCENFEMENLWCVETELEFSPDDGKRLLREVLRRLARPPEIQCPNS
jgi:tetraacyldisaccharide 4'-kinase